MPFVPVAAMGALVFTLINFLRFLTNKEFGSAVTQICSWAAGILVVVLVASTDYADGIDFGGKALSALNGSSQVFIGLMAASIFGVVKVAISALDSSDSAKVPPLVPGPTS